MFFYHQLGNFLSVRLGLFKVFAYIHPSHFLDGNLLLIYSQLLFKTVLKEMVLDFS